MDFESRYVNFVLDSTIHNRNKSQSFISYLSMYSQTEKDPFVLIFFVRIQKKMNWLSRFFMFYKHKMLQNENVYKGKRLQYQRRDVNCPLIFRL